MQYTFDSVRTDLVLARNSFLSLYTSRRPENELTNDLVLALKNVGTALDGLAALSVDMGNAVENWAPLFNAGALVTFGEKSDFARVMSNIDAVAFALGKDRSAAVRAIASRFAEYLAGVPLESVDAFKASLGFKIVKLTRKEVGAVAKRIKTENKAKIAAERAAKKAAAPKNRRTSVKAEYEAILAQLQKEVGLKAVKDPTTGKYVFTKAAA